jgi:mannitol-1-phosphate 5-dehydrogenase
MPSPEPACEPASETAAALTETQAATAMPPREPACGPASETAAAPQKGIVGLHEIPGMRFVPDFDMLMRRKIYTYNAASAIIAYLGAKKGYADYSDAANDAEIACELDSFYDEINHAVCEEYGVARKEQSEFASLSKMKFQNRKIKDSVGRNAAGPARKLSPDERIVGAARLIVKHGGRADALIKTAAAAISYMGVKDEADVENALTEICGLNKQDELHKKIAKIFKHRK